MKARLRQLRICYWLQFKIMALSPFEGFLSIVFPLMFATSALLVYRVRNDPTDMVYAGLGAAVMGIWTAMMVPAATLLSRERWAGTLELVVAAPTPFAMVLLPSTLASATLGLYSVVATMLWGWLVFGIHLTILSWPLFVLSLMMACVTIAMLGFLLSVTAIRYRTSWALGAALEYPGWLLCGFLIPLGLLPDVLRPLSWVLAPTWAMAAIRESASGGSPLAGPGRVPRARHLVRRAGGVPQQATRRLGPPARHVGADVSSLRIFFIGGLISYRAMFNWLNPWILVPSLLVSPICQVLLFAYIGRSARVGNDEFYLIGNALNYAAIPCLFAMGATIGGERYSQTLGIILTTPARRIPLFLGRSLPAIVNGWAVAMFGLVAGGLLLGVSIPWSSWPAIALVAAVTSASCTGLGLVIGAISLRVRESATLCNVVFLVLLVFCGVNVSSDALPGWMSAVGDVLPLTHGIRAAREVAAGGALADVTGLVVRELVVGAVFVAIGLSMLSALERLSRSRATLDLV